MPAPAFLLLLCLFFVGSFGIPAQAQLSKKEQKAQERKISTNRYFIEGEKAFVLGELEKANFFFLKAQALSPAEPAISYKLAEVLLRANKPQEALPFAEKAVAGDPQNLYYTLLVAEIYTGLKQPLKAAALLDSLTRGSDKNQQYNLDLASLYLNANAYDQALVVLDRAEAYYGVREAFTQQKQRIYLKKDQLENAIEEGAKLIDAFPGNPMHVLSLVEILYNNAKIDLAIALVTTELAKYPEQPELQMAAYTLYHEKRAHALAQRYLFAAMASPDLATTAKANTFEGILQELKTPEREALLDSLERLMLEVHPADAAVFAALGARKKANSQGAEALAWYKKSLALQPKNEVLLEEIIVNSFEAGADFGEVATYTAMGVEEFPESAEFWFYEGVVRASLKKDSLAVIGLETALRINADKNKQLSQVAYGTLGNSLFNLGDQTAAFANFDKALALNPDDEQVLNNYAYFLSLAKVNLDKALSMAERVVKKQPKNATYLDTLAWVLFQLKKYSEAATRMEEVLRLEPSPSGVMLEHYGDILFHLNRLPEAVSWWKKAQESSEGSDKLILKIQTSTYHD